MDDLINLLEQDKKTMKTSSHYDFGNISTIDVIKAKLSHEQYIGFLLGNIIKYSTRLNHKGQAESDAKKLAEYSQWLLKELQEKSNGSK